MMKRKYWVYTILVIGVGYFVYWGNKYGQKIRGEDYTIFNTSNIVGVVERTSTYHKGISVFIKGTKNELRLFEQVNSDGETVYGILDVGDSIIKPPFTDSIIIVKKRTGDRFVFPCSKESE